MKRRINGSPFQSEGVDSINLNVHLGGGGSVCEQHVYSAADICYCSPIINDLVVMYSMNSAQPYVLWILDLNVLTLFKFLCKNSSDRNPAFDDQLIY